VGIRTSDELPRDGHGHSGPASTPGALVASVLTSSGLAVLIATMAAQFGIRRGTGPTLPRSRFCLGFWVNNLVGFGRRKKPVAERG
jgi:hypothetical protein